MNSSIPKSISTVIHIGAGRCNQLKDYLEAENRRIFLYEVEERFTQALQPFSKRHSHVHVEQCAVVLGEAPNNVSFNCYSDGRYTSTLALSDGFLAQQINLEPTQTMETEALVLTDVLTACSASAENTLLVLDAPNMVTELGSEVLTTIFDSVCILQIQAPNDDVYDKALTPFLASAINGHEPHWLVKPLAAETRGFSNWQIERNTLVIELEHTIQQLSGERSDLKKTLEEIQAQHDTRGEQLAAQTSESEAAQAQLNELKARLDTKEQEAGEHAQQLAEERSALNDQLVALQQSHQQKEDEKAELRSTIDALAANLEAETSVRSKAQTEVEEARALVDLKETEKADLRNIVNSLEAKLASSQAEFDSLKEEKTQLTAEMKEAVAAQRLGQKLVAKYQSDLDDLRHKFKNKKEEYDELLSLVTKLSRKLETAALLYERLMEAKPEVIATLGLPLD